MKNITFLVVIFLLITGCAKTYIQVLDTSGMNTKLKEGYYVFENDTVKITYAFWENKGVMSFSIFNKTDKPLYIDWKNSSFIHNDNKRDYWIDETHTDLVGYYKGVYYNGPKIEPGYAVSAGAQISASSAVKAERITFIPPKSKFSKSSFLLLPVCYYESDNFTGTDEPRNDNPKKVTKVITEKFTYDSSPLRFRNYLAFSFVENSQPQFYVDNEFYLSSVTEMDIRHYRGAYLGSDNGVFIYEKPFKKPTAFFINIDLVKCSAGWRPNAK